MPESDPSDLGNRIAKAQAERAGKAARLDQKRKESINKPAGMALRYSAELVAAVIVGVGLGLLIDHFARTSPWGLLVFMGFGMAAGMRNVIRAAKRLTEDALSEGTDPEARKETRE